MPSWRRRARALPLGRRGARARRALQACAAAFLSSLALVVISVGFSSIWVVLAFTAGLALATVVALYLYDYLAALSRRARR